MNTRINASFYPQEEDYKPEPEDPDPVAVLLGLPEGETKTDEVHISRTVDYSIPGREIWEVELVEQDRVSRWRVQPPSVLVSYSIGTKQSGMTTQWDEQQIGTIEHFEAGLAKARELAGLLGLANQAQYSKPHTP